MNAWHLCMDVIPSKVNLIKSRITSDSRFLFCDSEGETGVHILWDCPFAACVWSFSILGRLPSGNCSHSVSEANVTIRMSLFPTRFPGGLVFSLSLPLILPSAPFRPLRGNFLADFSKFSLYVPSSLFAKALAVMEGLALGYSRGSQALYASSLDLSPIGLIVEDSRVISRGITRVSFTVTHIRRQANEVAHRLACFSLAFTRTSLWFEEPPDFILDVLFEDCSSKH
ncbi:hypothetical protein D8674_005069 [Pyrus ussuriensis x Pyrus communis]|uniref:Uncharacterized protein n=1 Tax=Pyrus ussuriensis x Pyrus communis TaxID=2448454 RepID=A0A5N5FW14_9ROSA|nr:hypothetical protein D8674_005069 [Pyrus ussuriensis x Pyrus communis]